MHRQTTDHRPPPALPIHSSTHPQVKGSRRPKVKNLHDVFVNIADDEAEHVKTMASCQDPQVDVGSKWDSNTTHHLLATAVTHPIHHHTLLWRKVIVRSPNTEAAVLATAALAAAASKVVETSKLDELDPSEIFIQVREGGGLTRAAVREWRAGWKAGTELRREMGPGWYLGLGSTEAHLQTLPTSHSQMPELFDQLTDLAEQIDVAALVELISKLL